MPHRNPPGPSCLFPVRLLHRPLDCRQRPASDGRADETADYIEKRDYVVEIVSG